MPRGTPQSLSPTEPVSRNGLSLARNGCSLSEASIPGSKVPTCYFATCQLVSPPGPPSAPHLQVVCPTRWHVRRFRPVAVLLARLARLLPLPPLPSGTFASLGIEAFNRFRRLTAHLPNPPDCLSLHAAGSISRVGCGSPFLARYVSGGLLFLKPLGTSINMPPNSLFRQCF